MMGLSVKEFLPDLSLMINDLGAGMAVFRGDTPDDLTLVYCNDVCLESYGLTASDLGAVFAKDDSPCIYPDDLATVQTEIAEAFQSGKPICRNIRVRGRDDTWKRVSLRAKVRCLNPGYEVYVLFLDTGDDPEAVCADAEKHGDLPRVCASSEKNSEFVIDVLGAAVEFKNFASGRHAGRVRAMTEIMMRTWAVLYPEGGFDDQTIRQVAMASILYDIGKVAIPDNILLKPGRLTREEFEIMKTHTVRGCELLERFKREDDSFYHCCYDICRYHHERIDGSGYPDGLKEDEIPVWAQIVSIVDVFDALISPRVYKAPYSTGTAVEMIRNGECGVFSDKLLRCFAAAKESILETLGR